MKFFARKTSLSMVMMLTLTLQIGCGGEEPGSLTEPASTSTSPVESVLSHYLKIQSELAKDSLQDMEANAKAIAKTVKGEENKLFSQKIAEHAETLAKAKDLKAGRTAFKSLSSSLIKDLASKEFQDVNLYEGHCPMVDAKWLQREADIKNPYMGPAMLTCGKIKKE